jgi:queuine tRNA-ribosyltransferase
MKATFNISGKKLYLPVFVPDGTFGVVRSIDAQDLAACKVQAVMMNTFHLMQKPGSSTIQAVGGLHNFSGWQGPIFTDSGGFQAYSLIKENSKFGQINADGISFTPEGSQRKFLLTPEKCIRLQMSYASNLLFCLDDCTHVDEPQADQLAAVERTIAWARRCKTEYLKNLEQRKIENRQRPLIFGIVQGGQSRELRKKCADALLEIGFDGYGFGGWPLDGSGQLVEDMVAYLRELIPNQFPLHALGIGHPENVVKSFLLGYQLFDSAMPTRDARHGRIYRFKGSFDPKGKHWWEYVYIQDQRHIKNEMPIDENCDCPACQKSSLAYLHHLFKIGDGLYQRLATIHNLRFMTQLCEKLREQSHA